MNNTRLERLSNEIRKDICVLLQEEIKDSRIGFVTITRVQVSGDLRRASVFFTVLGDEKSLRASKVGLKSASGRIRRLLGRRLRIRRIPEIHFVYDKNVEHSMNMEKLLDDIGTGEGQ